MNSLSKMEYHVIKGGAIKYALDFLVKPEFEQRFLRPIKAWVAAGPDQTRVVGGKKLQIVRPKAKNQLQPELIAADFMVLAKAGKLKGDDWVRLLETGAIGVTDYEQAAKLCSSQLGRALTGYSKMGEAGPPALRWPTKPGLQGWFYALKQTANLAAGIAVAARSRARVTMDKLLAQK